VSAAIVPNVVVVRDDRDIGFMATPSPYEPDDFGVAAARFVEEFDIRMTLVGGDALFDKETTSSYKYAAGTEAIDPPNRDRINRHKYRLLW